MAPTSDGMRYPLHWPPGWPRHRGERLRSRFGTKRWNGDLTVAGALVGLVDELRMLRARDVVVSSNVPTRNDGFPRSGARTPDDPGVAVYFKLSGKPRALACDRWRTVQENIRALALHIGAMRGMDRWGVGTLERAFDGYLALPETAGGPGSRPWPEVLGLDQHPGPLLKDVEDAYRALVRALHPDANGGKSGPFLELCEARRQALAWLRGDDDPKPPTMELIP